MIHEYGIEPELVVEWLGKAGPYARTLQEEFGVGTPRVLSRYPPSWRRLVLSAWEAWIKEREASATTDAERGRVQGLKMRGDALLKERLVEEMVWREGLAWEDSKDWLSNAQQHAPEPLYALLVRHAEGAPEYVLSGDAIFDSPRWNIPRSRLVSRDVKTLAKALAPFLSRSARLVFVDPWFRPERGHMQAFKEFLNVTGRRPGLRPPSIEVHTSVQGNVKKKHVPWDVFEEDLRSEIQGFLPHGWQVTIQWLAIEGDKEHDPEGSEKVHNRYILSERGGVTFGTGLDSGKEVHHDDVALMDREHFRKRWEQHTSSPMGFTLTRGGTKLVIDGDRKLRGLAPRRGR